MCGELGYAAAYVLPVVLCGEACRPQMKTQILISDFNQDQKFPDDDQLMIETC
jgi:hypothetical protein